MKVLIIINSNRVCMLTSLFVFFFMWGGSDQREEIITSGKDLNPILDTKIKKRS